MRIRRCLLTIAIVAFGQTAVAQTVTVDGVANTRVPQAVRLEAPIRLRDPPPLFAPPPAPSSAVPTVAGTFLGALLGGVAGLAFAQHEIEATLARSSDGLNGPDEGYIWLGYGIGGVVLGALVGGIVGHRIGQMSF